MSTVLEYISTTNSLSVSGASGVVSVAGSGIDNNFSVPQTFQAGITASGSTSLQAVSGTTGTFTGAVSVSGFSNAGNTSLQAVSGTTGTFTGAVSVSGFSNAGNTSLQAVSGTTGTFTGAVTALANAATNSGSLAGLTVSGTTTTELVITAPDSTTAYNDVITVEGG